MTETGAPYQAGESPAEKSLGQVNFEAAGYVEYRDEYGYHCYADRWDFMPDRLQEQYEAMAAAVEAEVLRRLYDHMRARQDEAQAAERDNIPAQAGYALAVCHVGMYARQRKQEGQT